MMKDNGIRIGIDIDGVIRNLHKSLRQIWLKADKKNGCLEIENWEDWNIHKYFWKESQALKYNFRKKYLTKDELLDFWFRECAINIFMNADCEPKAKEALDLLVDNNIKIRLISAQQNFRLMKYTMDWLAWILGHNYPIEEVIFSKEKWNHNFNVIIEDSPQQIESIKSNSDTDIIKINKPWNKQTKADYSFNSLYDAVRFLCQIDRH